MGNFLVVLPLFAAFVVGVAHLSKVLKQHPWSTNDKRELWVATRALLYAGGAIGLVLWLKPAHGGVSTVIGFVLSVILSTLIILSFKELPWTRLDDKLWQGGWYDPWKRTNDPDDRVPYVRWGRRFALLAFGLFALVAAIAAALSSPDAPAVADGGVNHPPAVIETEAAPAAPSPSVPEEESPEPEAPSASPSGTIINNCGGPTPIVIDEPTTAMFGPNDIEICLDAARSPWPVNVAPPGEVLVTAGSGRQDATYWYGVIVVDGTTSYLIRTTEFSF